MGEPDPVKFRLPAYFTQPLHSVARRRKRPDFRGFDCRTPLTPPRAKRSLGGPPPVGERAGGRRASAWGADGAPADAKIEDSVSRAIEDPRRRFHVHSERIYLAGFREGAALAYRLGLLYPERFGGVVSLNGSMPRHGGPLLRLPEVRQLPVLIGHGIAHSIVPLSVAPQG